MAFLATANADDETYLFTYTFDTTDANTVPGVLTGEVKKSRSDARAEYVRTHYPELDDRWVGSIVGSEDAFDAAVSALVMAEHTTELMSLAGGADREEAMEGRIWMPGA